MLILSAGEARVQAGASKQSKSRTFTKHPCFESRGQAVGRSEMIDTQCNTLDTYTQFLWIMLCVNLRVNLNFINNQ